MDNHWWDGLPRRSSAGVSVSTAKALTVPVVMDCLTVLSQSIATLPRAVFERLPNGDKRLVQNHPVAALFDDPDGESTSHEFVAQMVWDLASEGNFVAEIRPGALGFASALRRKEPHRVTYERLLDDTRRWTVAELNGTTRRYVDGEVWHVRDLPLIDQLAGMSRIYAGREAIGALIALQEYGAAFFENDATPPVMIEHPGNFADQGSRDNFLNQVKSWFGRKRKGPAVLEYGMKVAKIGTTPEEAQFLETRKELQTEVARLWRMPPHKVGIMENATFSNIEHQALEFVVDTLTPWIDLIESAINRHLIQQRQRYFFEFNVSGLLRGDIKARFEAYAQARNWGWLSVNEIRRMENLNPIGSRGDQYLQPLNMTPAGAEATEAAVFGPRGEVLSRRIKGEWTGAHDVA